MIQTEAPACRCGCGLPTKIASKDNPRYGWQTGHWHEFLSGHRARYRALTNYRVTDSGCWEWQGKLLHKAGYGVLQHHGKAWRAHRWMYEQLVGPIPPGTVLDHLCHNGTDCRADGQCPHRRCVNPAHLEPTTDAVNFIRGNSPGAVSIRTGLCFRGHEMSPQNTYTRANGARTCRTCIQAARDRRVAAGGNR